MRLSTSSQHIAAFKLIFLLLIVMICVFPVVRMAYADSSISTSSAEWKSGILEVGKIYETLTFSGGAIGLAWCGIEYTYGSEEVARKAKTKALIIAGATVALFLLPYFIKMGMQVGRAKSWSPESLK